MNTPAGAAVPCPSCHGNKPGACRSCCSDLNSEGPLVLHMRLGVYRRFQTLNPQLGGLLSQECREVLMHLSGRRVQEALNLNPCRVQEAAEP